MSFQRLPHTSTPIPSSPPPPPAPPPAPTLPFQAPLASCEDLAELSETTAASIVETAAAADDDVPQQQLQLPSYTRHSGTDTAKRLFNSRQEAARQLLLAGEPLQRHEPGDHYYMVYAIFVLHGIGALMPWNMFITAKDYFVDYKLSVEYTGVVSQHATNFLAYVGFASQIPNVIINWAIVFAQIRGSFSGRIIWCLVIMISLFIFTVIMAMVDSSEWPGIFFLVTIASVVFLNAANGIYQNTIYGLAAKLPFRYTGAVVLGSNISGTFTAVINIISIATAPNPRTAAIYYFIAALFVLLACFDTYFALPLSRFYRYYKRKSDRVATKPKAPATAAAIAHCDILPTATVTTTTTTTTATTTAGRGRHRPPYWLIFRRTLPQLFNVFLVFFVTLSVFPSVLADIRPMNEDFLISPKYFAAVLCFLTFNLSAMIGNILPMKFVWPSARWLWLPVLLRLLFLPYFALCNYRPVNMTRTMRVYVTSDWGYWVACGVMGVTSGYFSSLAMMYCPRMVEPRHATVSGMMASAALVTGVCCGVQFSLVLSWLVTA